MKNSLFNQTNVSMGTAGVAGEEKKQKPCPSKKVSQHNVGNVEKNYLENKIEGQNRESELPTARHVVVPT